MFSEQTHNPKQRSPNGISQSNWFSEGAWGCKYWDCKLWATKHGAIALADDIRQFHRGLDSDLADDILVAASCGRQYQSVLTTARGVGAMLHGSFELGDRPAGFLAGVLWATTANKT